MCPSPHMYMCGLALKHSSTLPLIILLFMHSKTIMGFVVVVVNFMSTLSDSYNYLYNCMQATVVASSSSYRTIIR